jgi:murein DD-endopeptidase MepM/ murein hydrolase activator NlpD
MIDYSNIKLIQPVSPTVPGTSVGGIISQAFGENPQAYKRFGQAGHNGIDYAVPVGTPVMAAADGIVKKAEFDKNGYGNFVLILHGTGYTLYGHLSKILVDVLQLVNVGEVIGYSGNTGNSTGAHLHFELRIPEEKSKDYPQGAVDPSPFFEAGPSQSALGTSSFDTSVDNGSADIKQVKVCVPAGANLRLTPAGKHCTSGGKIVAAAPMGTILDLCDVNGEWYGVMLWVHKSVVALID